MRDFQGLPKTESHMVSSSSTSRSSLLSRISKTPGFCLIQALWLLELVQILFSCSAIMISSFLCFAQWEAVITFSQWWTQSGHHNAF